MAKGTVVKEEAVAQEEIIQVRMSPTVLATGDQVAKLLKKSEVGEEVSAEYKKWEIGEVIRAVVTGRTTIMNRRNEPQDAIKLFTEDQESVISADVALVSHLRKFALDIEANKPASCFEISCTGEKTTPNGTYKTFKVHKLNVPGA